MSKPKDRQKKIKTKMLIPWVIMGLMIVVIVILFATKTIGFIEAEPSRDLSTSVCDEEVIKRYNTSYNEFLESGRQNKTNYTKVASEIENLKDYKTDPNCVYMLIQYNSDVDDYGKAYFLIDDLEKLYNDNKFVNGKYLGTTDLHSLRQEIVYYQSLKQQVQSE